MNIHSIVVNISALLVLFNNIALHDTPAPKIALCQLQFTIRAKEEDQKKEDRIKELENENMTLKKEKDKQEEEDEKDRKIEQLIKQINDWKIETDEKQNEILKNIKELGEKTQKVVIGGVSVFVCWVISASACVFMFVREDEEREGGFERVLF